MDGTCPERDPPDLRGVAESRFIAFDFRLRSASRGEQLTPPQEIPQIAINSVTGDGRNETCPLGQKLLSWLSSKE